MFRRREQERERNAEISGYGERFILNDRERELNKIVIGDGGWITESEMNDSSRRVISVIIEEHGRTNKNRLMDICEVSISEILIDKWWNERE